MFLQEDYEPCRAILERTARDQSDGLGAFHPDTFSTLQNLGSTQQALGDLEAARATFERVLSGRVAMIGADHPDTTLTRANLVQVLRKLDPPAAGPHIQDLHRLFERPEDSLTTAERTILEFLREEQT
jgi:hypothetical protein